MDKSTLNTSSSFQSKLDEIKSKAKTRTPTGKLNQNNIQLISNPKMNTNFKQHDINKDIIIDTGEDSIPNETECVNSISTNNVNKNNLSEINTRYSNYLPRYSDDFVGINSSYISSSNNSINCNLNYLNAPYQFQTKFINKNSNFNTEEESNE